MDRRRTERNVRRIPVRFREVGTEGEPRHGYATNISVGGMYIATGTPSSSRTRLRIEVGEPPDDFTVEGVVAHSKRLAPELRMLGLSGMGVRFLTVRELVTDLLGGVAADDGAKSGAGGPDDRIDDGLYRLRFESAEHFLKVTRNDIAHGGLFVPTRQPAALDRRIVVQVELPVPGLDPVRLQARVVQRIEPSQVVGKPDLLAGMGLQLEEPEAAKRSFRPAIEALSERG